MASEYSLEPFTTDHAGVVAVKVAGELDLTNASELEARLEESAAGELLVLDLNAVTFVDSAALHVLFRLARKLGRGRFGVAIDEHAVVARALAIVELSSLATIRESVDDCVTALAATD